MEGTGDEQHNVVDHVGIPRAYRQTLVQGQRKGTD